MQNNKGYMATKGSVKGIVSNLVTIELTVLSPRTKYATSPSVVCH